MQHNLKPIFIALLLLTSCASPATNPSAPAALTPFLTTTPSPTLAQAPEVIFGDTPLPSPTPFTYTVKAGDTMGAIAQQFGIPLAALMAANPLVSPNAMPIGATLFIPADADNPSGAPTPTPALFAITQVNCYSTADGGMWCFALAHNDSDSALDNLSARLTLLAADGKLAAAQIAIPPLNVLPPHSSLPLTAFFPLPIATDATPRIQTLTSIAIQADDARYLAVSLQNTAVEIASNGRTAKLSGEVLLSANSTPAKTVWVAAIGYDAAGRVTGFRRWEWLGRLAAGASLPFGFEVPAIGSELTRVEFFVEARP